MRTVSGKHLAVSVRPWTPEDDEFVAKLAGEAFAEYSQQASRHVLETTHQVGTKTWIAAEGAVPLGMVVLGHHAGGWSVLAIAVSARARACGIGTRLMRVVERHAVAHGALRLSLVTADSNLAALDLFLRSGFRIVRRRPSFYSRRQDACELEKVL